MATVDPSGGAWDRLRWRTLAHLIACGAAGVLAGIIWAALAPRAQYRIDENLAAALSERAYAEIIGGDAAFAIIMAAFGIGVGVLTWIWFHKRGWAVILMALLGSAVLALMSWQIGQIIGGDGVTERVAAAQVGDLVQMDLELHSLSALAVAPFTAITPIMLFAAFLPERLVDADEETDGGR